ncbi:MAG: hypothetical protein ACLUD2_18580 [Clostridium sp.]
MASGETIWKEAAYQSEAGSYLGAGWQRIEANWYLLDDQGYRLTGWQERDGKPLLPGYETGELATGAGFVWNDNWYYAPTKVA